MILIASYKLVKIITLGKARAITLYPFVLVETKEIGDRIIRHEKIHLRQQIELLLLPFYTIYLLEFLIHFLKCRDFDRAYRSISFEREAYKHDNEKEYLQTRKWFEGFKYFNLRVQD